MAELTLPDVDQTYPHDKWPRILLADDNADMCEYVGRLLADHYEVEAPPDGQVALEAAR